VNYTELRRFLAKNGCTFETHKGGSGHITVRRGERTSQLPAHGKGKELGKSLVHKILKDLELK
jgi:mRNA interferase HicA